MIAAAWLGRYPILGSVATSEGSPTASDGVAKTELAAARHRCQNKTEAWLAGNMVAWWSQTITEGNNPWGDRFERKKDKNNQWAYKPRSAS